MAFVRVIVTRQESTELYIEIPDGFDMNLLMRNQYQRELARIADKTADDALDWDNSEWEDTLQVQRISKVTEHEARQYACGELVVQTTPAVTPAVAEAIP